MLTTSSPLRDKVNELYTQAPVTKRKSLRDEYTPSLMVRRPYDERIRKGFRMLAESYDDERS